MVTCSECQEYGHTGYVCPKKKQSSQSSQARSKAWIKKEPVNQIMIDEDEEFVTWTDLGAIRIVSHSTFGGDVLAGKHTRGSTDHSDEEDQPTTKESRGTGSLKGCQKGAGPEVVMRDQVSAGEKRKKPRKKRNSLLPPICEKLEPYSVIQDILDRPVKMSFGQLMVLCPGQRKALTSGLSVQERKAIAAASSSNNMVAFTGWIRQHNVPMCTALIEGVAIKHAIIDGGSATNILNLELLLILGLSIQDLSVCPLFFKGALQEQLPVVGIWDKARVTVQGISVTIAFTVVRMRLHNGYPALLGQPWLELVRGQHDWS